MTARIVLTGHIARAAFYDAVIFDNRVSLRIRVNAIIRPKLTKDERQTTMAFDSALADPARSFAMRERLQALSRLHE